MLADLRELLLFGWSWLRLRGGRFTRLGLVGVWAVGEVGLGRGLGWGFGLGFGLEEEEVRVRESLFQNSRSNTLLGLGFGLDFGSKKLSSSNNP